MNKIKMNYLGFSLALGLLANVLPGIACAGASDGGGISFVHLSCNNLNHPSVSYDVSVMSPFKGDNGKIYPLGVVVNRLVHFSNLERLVKAVPVIANESYTDVSGNGFSLTQSGPGNFNMKQFPATITLDEESGARLVVTDLQCTKN